MKRQLMRWGIWVGVLLWLYTVPAWAQSTPPELDILLLIDQSGSMGGIAYDPNATAANDPLGLRFQVAQYALRTLNSYRQVMPANTIVKVGVLYFGDSVQRIMDWQTIDDAWNASQETFLQLLSSDSYGKKSLGNTNFVDAYSEAKALFDQLPSTPTQLRVLLTLTDGAPCAPSRPEWGDKTCATLQDAKDHMQALLSIAQANFPEANYRLYIVAVDTPRESRSFWEIWRQDWEQVVRNPERALSVSDATNVGPVYLRILSALVRELRGADASSIAVNVAFDEANNSATVSVSPYKSSMRVTIFKTENLPANLQITDPNGQALSEAFASVSVTGAEDAIEIWTVKNPIPGDWQLALSKENRLDVFLDLITVQSSLNVVNDPLPFEVLPIALQLSSADGTPLPQYTDSRYQLNASIVVTAPDGSPQTFPLSSLQNGLYGTNGFTPTQEGTYRVDYRAETQDLDGSPLLIASQSDALTFTVDVPTLQVEGIPTTGMTIEDKVILQGKLLDNAQQIVKSPETRVTISVLQLDKTPWVSFDLALQPDGTYYGELVLEQVGQFQVIAEALRGDTLISQQNSSLFNVKPAQLILLQIDTPANEATLFTTQGFPPQPLTHVVRVKAVTEDTTTRAVTPADLSTLTGGNVPLVLLVKDNVGTTLHTLPLAPTEGIGTYAVSLPSLAVAPYTLELVGEDSELLQNNARFDSRTRTQTIAITVAEDPTLNTIYALIGVGIAILTVIGGIIGIRFAQARRHPMRGTLKIVSRSYKNKYREDVLWERTLSGKNYYAFHSKTLRDVPTLDYLRVECPNEGMSSRNEVYVSARTANYTLGKTILAFGNETMIHNGEEADYYARWDEL